MKDKYLAAANIYKNHRGTPKPFTIKELAELFDISPKDLARAYREIVKNGKELND